MRDTRKNPEGYFDLTPYIVIGKIDEQHRYKRIKAYCPKCSYYKVITVDTKDKHAEGVISCRKCGDNFSYKLCVWKGEKN